MLLTINKFLNILNNSIKKKLYFLIFLNINFAILEIFGIALIIPLLNFIINKENFGWISNLSEKLNIDEIFLMIILVVSLYLIKNIILTLVIYKQNKILATIRHYISTRIFEIYSKKNYSYFTEVNSSLVTKNLISLINDVNSRIIIPIGVLITDLILVIFFSVFLLSYNIQATSILLFCLIAPSLIYFNIFKHRLKRFGHQFQINEEKRVKIVNETIGAIKYIKILNKESFFVDKYKNVDSLVSLSNHKYIALSQTNKFFLEVILIIGLFILLFMELSKNIESDKLIILLSLYASAAFKLFPTFSRILSSTTSLRFGENIINILYDLINSDKSCKEYTNKINKIDFNNTFELKNIYFNYPKANKAILKNINFYFNKNKITAIVGKSGSGKTTLINILLGITEPLSGDIFIDGKMVSNKNENYTRLFGFVPQDIFLLNDSIINNIAFGVTEEDIDIKKIWKCIKDVDLTEFVKSQKQGLETILGDNAIRISGGQKQRIAIARSLYADKKILILDEATSALDNLTEMKLVEKLIKLKDNLTIVIITHKKDILKYCDVVFELKNKHLKIINEKN